MFPRLAVYAGATAQINDAAGVKGRLLPWSRQTNPQRLSATADAVQNDVVSVTWRATMTSARLHRQHRNRLLVPVALLVCLSLLGVGEIVTFQGFPPGPIGALTLGMILGAATGSGLVVRQRWRIYLASRT